jgi:hypothetical protein
VLMAGPLQRCRKSWLRSDGPKANCSFAPWVEDSIRDWSRTSAYSPTGTCLCHDRVRRQDTSCVKEIFSRINDSELSYDTRTALSCSVPAEEQDRDKDIS